MKAGEIFILQTPDDDSDSVEALLRVLADFDFDIYVCAYWNGCIDSACRHYGVADRASVMKQDVRPNPVMELASRNFRIRELVSRLVAEKKVEILPPHCVVVPWNPRYGGVGEPEKKMRKTEARAHESDWGPIWPGTFDDKEEK